MSHCDNCNNIDRLERVRDRAIEDRNGAMDLKALLQRWGWGKGLLRFFFSYADRTAMWEGAVLRIAACGKLIDDTEAEIERAEKSTLEGQVKHAAKKIEFSILSDAFSQPQKPVAAIKSFAEVLDADLRFEDRVKETKLDDLPGIKPEERRHLHQGTHYEGDSCLGGHKPPEGQALEPVPRTELFAMYKELPTPELKNHVEAALDAAVQRGIDMTVGDLAKKGVEVSLKEVPRYRHIRKSITKKEK